ncbi:MAG TPA: AAA family ATPase [Flavobacteriaceae bacterium]|nr:AAA family ATPase [Flavobacteriaceae bacterium]
MEELYEYSNNLLAQTDDKHYRFLMGKINWDQQMLGIKGPRGSGKTTLMLQYLKFELAQPEKMLYMTADHYWFYTHNLVETADTFYKNGGRYLFIDEVHKYPRWSRELKNIYDGYPNLKVVFSASSVLDIYRGEADLSRRVISYNLPGLSFREYLLFHEVTDELPALSLKELLENPVSSTQLFLDAIGHPLPLFKKYLKSGYLPIAIHKREEEIPIILNQVINTIIEGDLAFLEGYDSGTAFKLKKLLGVIAESVPFKPNISALARKLNLGREMIYSWFTLLQKAQLLNLLTVEGKGVSLLQKPDKVYLENPNLAYALKSSPDIGNLRETFMMNQLNNVGLEIRLPKSGDFYLPEFDLYIEVGGKNKTATQVKDNENFMVAKDDIEIGGGKTIPLWLFGMLY